MSGNASLFDNYSPYTIDYSIKIADGTTSKVLGIGSIKHSESITFYCVLYVPNLICNLLSIRKFSRDLNCVAKFFPSHCEFQDSISGKRIGNVRLYGGLYIFSTKVFLKEQTQASCGFSKPINSFSVSFNKDSVIMLEHYCLGHPNFSYLENLVPSLFINKNLKSFQCEVCQLAKHTQSNYPNHEYKSYQPFSMIHSDIWGPTRVKNITRSKWFVSFVDDHTRTTWMFLMKDKFEVSSIIKSFNNIIQTQFATKFKFFELTIPRITLVQFLVNIFQIMA